MVYREIYNAGTLLGSSSIFSIIRVWFIESFGKI